MDNTIQPYIVGKVMAYDGHTLVGGITVSLRCLENQSAAETVTDGQGSFIFCGLILGNTYVVKAQLSSELRTDEITVNLDTNCDLGSVFLHI